MENNKKTKEYWEKRARENENKVYAKGSEVKKALEEHYLKARKEIRKSVSELVARYMDKTELSYIEAVTYLTSSEFKEWRMTLEEYEEEIKRLEKISPEFARKLRIELETLATKSRITRLESLNTQIDMELTKKSIKDYDVIRDGVSKTYSDFFKIQTTEFGLDGANTVLPKKTIEMLMQQPWSGSNFSERIWDNSSALARVLKQEIIQAFMQGVSVKDLSDRIEKRFESDRYNTERLVRTELNYALNQSTKLSYDEAGIKEYEFLAEIDSRTSDICRELNGQIFKMKDARAGVNYPPMHPHCRSTTIPVMNYEDIKARKTKPKSEDADKNIETKPEKNGIIELETSDNITIKKCLRNQVEYKGIKRHIPKVDEKNIISNLGGGDKTQGSCSSLAFAYIGNKAGYEVLDFRDGKSRILFASRDTIKEIASLKGVKSFIVDEKNDFVAIKKLIVNMEDKKEYYLSIGRHAAILRKEGKKYEYLELQSFVKNGFKPFNMDVLKKRFSCQKSYKVAGKSISLSSILIDSDTLKGSKEFHQILGFINTAENKQVKGAGGYEK